MPVVNIVLRTDVDFIASLTNPEGLNVGSRDEQGEERSFRVTKAHAGVSVCMLFFANAVVDV